MFNKHSSRGVRFKVVVFDIQGFSEIVVGEIVAKSPYEC